MRTIYVYYGCFKCDELVPEDLVDLDGQVRCPFCGEVLDQAAGEDES